MPRDIAFRYDDPLDLIWLACARELNFRVVRSTEVFASSDGQGTLTLTTGAEFDPDDSLAQLIFHELCHGLVGGPALAKAPDWGLENVDDRDLVFEHACHRLQAKLLDQHGLRGLLAVTTEHRPYWDALPLDPLGPGDDPAIPLAREAFERASEGPWAEAIARALARTQQLAQIMRLVGVPSSSLWSQTRALHASGFPLGDDPAASCGLCAWSFHEQQRLRCRQTRAWPRRRGTPVDAGSLACNRFEPRLSPTSCEPCGACCREGFDRVEISGREPVRTQHPGLVVVDGFGPHLPRPQGRCVALDEGARHHYRCRIYPVRPRACREFAVASDACLSARRRVGLSA